MSGKWTPGPWYAGGDDYGRTISGYQLRDMAKIRVSENDDADMVEELEANARLMATSPELFDALETCVSALEIWRLMQPVPNDGLDRFVEKGRAALAKARGEGA